MRSAIVKGAALVVLSAVLAGPAACERGSSWDDPGPEATFRDFLMHWFKNEPEAAFQMIDREDREALTEPLGSLRNRLDESALPEPEEMLVAGRVDNPYDIKSIDVKPPLERAPDSGESVELLLTYQDGRTGTATMIWRGDAWYVDLPDRGAGEGKRTDASADGGDTGRGDAGRRGGRTDAGETRD